MSNPLLEILKKQGFEPEKSEIKVEDMTDQQLVSAGRFGWWSETDSEVIRKEIKKRGLQ